MPPGRIADGEATLQGQDLLKMPKSELRELRGGKMAMIFQDPMTSLNPVFTIGDQISEALAHAQRGHEARTPPARARSSCSSSWACRSPSGGCDQYPHEFSGGMRQRAMIAMAIANDPSVLIADEPTTALDVTIQAQIVEVSRPPSDETHAAIILITHDLGLIAELADRVVVMYAGRVVELGDVYTIFDSPRHPYTVGLMSSLARVDMDKDRLEPIPGQPPSLISPPPGCAFHPRCTHSQRARDLPDRDSARCARPRAAETTAPRATSRRSSRACAIPS